MQPASLRPNETESLLALEDLRVMDSAREADFQALVEVASMVCGVPISLISLIDRDRQFFKANTGMGDVTESGRDISFCAHAVLGDSVFEIPDTSLDQRFFDNPLVTGDTAVRFYAGAPIKVHGDIAVGSLCVVDRQPRRLDPVQRQVLEKLALVAGRALETRAAWLKFNEHTQALATRARDLRREAVGLHHVNGLLQETAEAFNEAQRLGHIGSWEMDFAEDPAYDITTWSDEMYRITGRVVGSVPPTLSERLASYAPEGRETLAAAIRACREHGTPYAMELEFVRVSDGVPRWLDTRGAAVQDDAGNIVGIRGTAHDITERRRTEAALRSSQEFLERTGRLAGVGGWEVELATSEVIWSPEVCRIHGVAENYRPTIDQAIGFYAPSSQAAVVAAVERSVATGENFDLEAEIVRPNGELRGVRVVGSAGLAGGVVVRLSGAFQDVTERRRLAQELAEQNELIRVTLRSIGDAVITTDASGRITWLNPVAERMTGWLNQEARGQALRNAFNVVDEDSRGPAPDLVAACLERGEAVELAHRSLLIARDGSERGIEDSASPIRSESGELLGAVLVFRDVSEQRRLSSEMAYRATHDSLTGLTNRAEFENRLQRSLDVAHADDSRHALLYIDLDQFKLVNDACGHAAGDQLLKQVARILEETVRGRDTIARLGGDEFAVLLEHCTALQARRVAQGICDRMDEYRFLHDDRRFRIGASIGLVPLDKRWDNTDAVQQAADASCYAAKEGGRNRFHEWIESDSGLRTRHGEMQWTTRIERALDNDAFVLFAQRIHALQTGRPGLHAEVLVRLRDPDGTLVPPGAFLPAAERFHLANRIDRWVVGHAVAWLKGIPDLAAIDSLSINLSGQSVGDRAFHAWLYTLLADAGAEVCNRLCFEITETAAVTHMADAALFVQRVRADGIRVALDDFGSGASSFGYLKNLQVDILKIDGQFVRDVVTDPLDEAAVRCFVDVAKVMGMRTVAEFVDHPAVLTRLVEMGVDYAQGYLLHRPAPIGELLERGSLLG